MLISFNEPASSPLLKGHLNLGDSRIDVTSLYITRDCHPTIDVSGEFHFSRCPQKYWAQELCKMKAGGITIVSTYLFWIYHEETEGQICFDGDLDVRRFVIEAQKAGLDVILRLGPWAHGECRNGGFPDWLLKKNLTVRQDDENYLKYVRIWYAAVFKEVQGLLFRDGGNIIGVQLDNELTDNAEHLLTLKKIAIEVGFNVPLYTVTGWNSVSGARIPSDEVLPVFGGYPDAPWDKSLNALPSSPNFVFQAERNDNAIGHDLLSQTASDGWRLPYERYPFATCELGCGLQPTHHRRPIVTPMDAYALSLIKLGCGNNLIGYYMYHGGTNKRGRLSDFNETRASGYPNDYPTLNYDFQAPLSQYGEARKSYGLLNLLHLFVHDFGEILAPMRFAACKNANCALRTDGKSGFLFISLYRRLLQSSTVYGSEFKIPGVEFPVFDLPKDTCCFFPYNIRLKDAILSYALAQPIAKQDDLFVFMAVDGINPVFAFENEAPFEVMPGSCISTHGIKLLVLKQESAIYLRRLGDRLYLGDGCNLYMQDKVIKAIEPGRQLYFEINENGRIPHYIGEDTIGAALIMDDCEPFDVDSFDLEIGGKRRLIFKKLKVTSPIGFVSIPGEYDAAQVYIDGVLSADNFFTGREWRLPADMLYNRDVRLVMSDLKNDFYREL